MKWSEDLLGLTLEFKVIYPYCACFEVSEVKWNEVKWSEDLLGLTLDFKVIYPYCACFEVSEVKWSENLGWNVCIITDL